MICEVCDRIVSLNHFVKLYKYTIEGPARLLTLCDDCYQSVIESITNGIVDIAMKEGERDAESAGSEPGDESNEG